MASGIETKANKLFKAEKDYLLANDYLLPVFYQNMSVEQRRILLENPDLHDKVKEREIRACENSYIHYFCNWLSASPSEGGARQGVAPLEHQLEYAEALLKYQIIYIVKSRRVFITTSTIPYFSWLGGIRKGGVNTNTITVSVSEKKATEFVQFTRQHLMFLPSWIRPEMGRGIKNPSTGKSGQESTQVISFPARNSSINISVPTNVRGSDYAAGLIDEAAHIKDIKGAALADVIDAVEPAISDLGVMIVASTANGTSGAGQVFHDRYMKLKENPEEGAKTFFFGRASRPDFAGENYLRAKANKSFGGDMARARQEYPATEQEAFGRAIEGLYYPLNRLMSSFDKGDKYDKLLNSKNLPFDHVVAGIDWGTYSAIEMLIPLANGSVFVAKEYVTPDGTSPRAVYREYRRLISELRAINPHFTVHDYHDAAGTQQIYQWEEYKGEEVTGRISFGGQIRNSTKSQKVYLVQHIAQMFENIEEGYPHNQIYIGKECQLLRAELKKTTANDQHQLKKTGTEHPLDALICAIYEHWNNAILGSDDDTE